MTLSNSGGIETRPACVNQSGNDLEVRIRRCGQLAQFFDETLSAFSEWQSSRPTPGTLRARADVANDMATELAAIEDAYRDAQHEA